MTSTTGATGSADPTTAWFEQLERLGNSRETWAATRKQYRDDVRAPVEAFLSALDEATGAGGVPAHGRWRVYTPHNDLRFDRQRPPLKTFVGATAPTPGGGGLHVQVSAAGLLVALGMPVLAPDQLPRWRSAVADDDAGAALASAVAAARAAGLTVDGGRPRPLVRAPRGVPTGHARAEWLRWKGVEARRRVGEPTWADTHRRLEVSVRTLAEGAPLLAWLEGHVGPSSLPRPR